MHLHILIQIYTVVIADLIPICCSTQITHNNLIQRDKRVLRDGIFLFQHCVGVYMCVFIFSQDIIEA